MGWGGGYRAVFCLGTIQRSFWGSGVSVFVSRVFCFSLSMPLGWFPLGCPFVTYGHHLNTVERYYTYIVFSNNDHLNDEHAIHPNKIFDFFHMLPDRSTQYHSTTRK